MAYSTDVEAARLLATQAHSGQTDKAGLPYITHPMRVAGRLVTPEAQVVGWLHDTVEDTTVTLSEIEARFGPDTAAAVDAISRRDGEAWSDYLDRVAANPVARQAKISDLISDYAQLLAYRGEEGRMESDQRYDEFMEMLHERRERRRDFTRGVLKTAAGVALGNKISDKLKNKD